MKQAPRFIRFFRIPVPERTHDRRETMRTTLILLAAGSAALATPAFAQVGGVAGQVTGDVTGQVNPGEVASDTAGRVTQPVGDVVGQTDDMVNDTADSANHKLARSEGRRVGQEGGSTCWTRVSTVC